MPRKKPTSSRQKKEEQQLKRAIKRGDVEPPPPKKPQNRKKRPLNARSIPNVASESSRKLQSSFIKISPAYLKRTQELASTLPLHRPIPAEASIFADQSTEVSKEPVTCPSRPKWNYGMSKKEVEHNEEGWFKRWLNQTDELVSKWQMSMDFSQLEGEQGGIKEPPTSMPPGGTCFERNLEVWRQLWRVTEISDIVLVLLDSRCPPVHLPPSLVRYLSKHQVILVLTKSDICGPLRVAAWKKYLHDLYPQFSIIEVSSYAPKDQSTLHQGRTLYEPYLPSTFRRQLVDAIKNLCTKLLEPPENVKSKPAALKQWRPKVKRNINWEDAYHINSTEAGKIIGGAAVPLTHAEGNDEESPLEPPFLTIGLIGQPNVGKSSLLNALFGENRVRASKTPGKTKHFQTLFWTSDIRLVDCPGLVMPNYMPTEMQVLCGVLPIARLSAIPACVYFAAQLLPLEKIFRLTHPSVLDPPPEDKRTWREGMKRSDQKPITWTAMDILVAYAIKKCWFTSQAGRPDIHRAGNAILRALAENKIPWAFWPPGTPFNLLEMNDDDKGLWISRDEIDSDEEENSSEGENSDAEGSDNSDDGGTMVDEAEYDSLSVEEASTVCGDDEVQFQAMNIGGRFALLNFKDVDDDDED
ncbi:P-loop containing nucleoside triphosphate hydrolase protein [Marasmius fiardii PR-910]|nr:P-loop containing nucleoside triphosphate hydrolase protein [Marasmius fiardii PR-910]